MKAATCRRIAWVANALCLAAVLIFLGYDIKYGLPRYDTSSFLWFIADWLGPLVVVLIALVAALVNMTLASCRDERESPSAMSEVEFHRISRLAQQPFFLAPGATIAVALSICP